jgi:hypothetical protein
VKGGDGGASQGSGGAGGAGFLGNSATVTNTGGAFPAVLVGLRSALAPSMVETAAAALNYLAAHSPTRREA